MRRSSFRSGARRNRKSSTSASPPPRNTADRSTCPARTSRNRSTAEKRGIRGGYGRAAAVSPKKIVTGIANDRTPALMRYAGHAEMTALLIKLAQKDVDNGVDVTGFIIEEQAIVR